MNEDDINEEDERLYDRIHALEAKCDLLSASLKKADAEIGYLRSMARSCQEAASEAHAEVESLGYLRETDRALLVEVERLKGWRDDAIRGRDAWAADMNEAARLCGIRDDECPLEAVSRVVTEVERLKGERDRFEQAARSYIEAHQVALMRAEAAEGRLALITEPTPEVVERVANAMWSHDAAMGWDEQRHGMGEQTRSEYRAAARAALRALAEIVGEAK